MKKMFLMLTAVVMLLQVYAQDNQLTATVAQLDKAKTVKDYQALATKFASAANTQKTNWLPFYYAAYCNARIGFMLEDDGERVEPFANDAETYGKQAEALLKGSTDKHQQAELYAVLFMVYRSRVFINPMTYGREYGIRSQQYLDKAAQLDPQNPRVLYLQSWVKYYTPKMWGGDKEKAKTLATEALSKLQAQTATGEQPHWGKAESEEILAKYNR
ncbi:hypothetical protein F0L74_21195 [Chitinophaga agrisoli]|uniref:Tetratricopeptide repeat protein n=1 Tax=Chitinophaga agrisoli TaxID=2607653 RepID=A0A5B2VIJ1_9BACT|nr:hypothetical protein [Chitinophaga agrisoli]KAA2238735.1 hypothetical protein F0L74_21195 [Chitinophaga agrisoli]